MLAVAVAGGTPLPIVLAALGSRTSFLSGGFLGGAPRLEAELVVVPIVGPIIVVGAAARRFALGPRRGPFAPRCVVTIPASAAPAAAASPAATATPRLIAGAVPLGAFTILEDPALGRINVVDPVIILAPAGVTILAPGGLSGSIATPRGTQRLRTGLVRSGVSRTLDAGTVPGRSPRGLPRLGAFATTSVTAASPARRATAVTATFAAAVFFPSARGRTVGRATFGASFRTTVRTPVNNRAILEAEVVGPPIGGCVARWEIPGGSLGLRETLTAPGLSFRTALERFRSR